MGCLEPALLQQDLQDPCLWQLLASCRWVRASPSGLPAGRDWWVQRSDAAEAVVSFVWDTLPYRTWRDHIAGRQCMDTTQVWHGRLIQGVDMCTTDDVGTPHHVDIHYLCKKLPYHEMQWLWLEDPALVHSAMLSVAR